MTALANHRQSAPVSGRAPAVPIQPGGGWAIRLELLWGRAHRKYLPLGRRGYVARSLADRRGECPGCRHDIIHSRDPKLCANACGYRFPTMTDRFARRDTVPIARTRWAEVVLFGGGAAAAAAPALFVW